MSRPKSTFAGACSALRLPAHRIARIAPLFDIFGLQVRRASHIACGERQCAQNDHIELVWPAARSERLRSTTLYRAKIATVAKVAIAAALLSAAAHSAPFAQVPANDAEHNTRRKQEFTQFNPRFESLKADRVKRLRALGAEVARREADRQSTACSHQILWELTRLVGT